MRKLIATARNIRCSIGGAEEGEEGEKPKAIKYKHFDSNGDNKFFFPASINEYDDDEKQMRIQIEETSTEKRIDDPHAATSANLWDGSILLAKYVTSNKMRKEFRNSTVIELGAGLGE